MVRAPLLVLMLVFVHSVALAQTAPLREPEVEAGERFARGVELFKEEAYRAALVEFQRAYTTAPDFRLLYNIGRTQLKLQDYLGAAQSYERYLREGGAEVPSERRVQVEEALAELRSRVGGIRLTANRAGLDVLLDDVDVGKTPLSAPILANVGRHRVVVRAPDGSSATRTVDVAGGDLVEVSMTLAEAAVASKSIEPERRGFTGRQKLALAGWITGGLLLAGSAATGVMALSEEDELAGILKTRNYNKNTADDERTAIRMLAITSDVLLGVGAATVLTSTILWFSRGGREKREASSVAPRTKLAVGFGSAFVARSF